MKSLFSRFSNGQKIAIGIAAIVVIACVFATAKWNREQDFKPLFTGVSGEDAGPMLAKLKESAVEYRVGDNGSTILLPSAQVAQLRLPMAPAGVPRAGRVGYEPFDKTNFWIYDFTH